MGKTALATNMAFNAARASAGRGRRRQEPAAHRRRRHRRLLLAGNVAGAAATRILAEQTRIPSDRIRRGMVAADKFSDLVMASRELQRLPMFIDDTPALSISAMRTRARCLKRQHGLDMIVIDYLLIAPSAGSRHDNRVQELSEITRVVWKTLAKELEVPVLALSQLSRAVEQRRTSARNCPTCANPGLSSRTPTW
ncbi:MAG: DnaB-like helicase C-terminal domain-containing protein [Rhodospirillales bacterium]